MFLVAQHSQNEKFCYRVIVATQKLYELLPQEKAQSQQPSISPDSIASHGKFIDKHHLEIILLSDPEHQIAEDYGVWQLKKFMGKEYMGIIRSTFLIDPSGKIAQIWSNVKVKNHVDSVLAQVRSLVSNK
jgi:thioredoxin-dependent peroxiredoxin